MKSLLILPDVHLTTEVSKPYQVVKQFIQKNKFDKTIILGDFMDVSSLSYYDLSKRGKIEGQRYEKEVEIAKQEIDFLQKYNNDIVWLEGNHEFRVRAYCDDNPELKGLLEIPKLLELKKRGIKWIPLNEPYTIGKLNFIHGVYYNKYHSQKHLIEYGDNICYGHTHRPQITYSNQKFAKRPYGSFGLGCLGDTAPEYKKNAPTSWVNQFAICYMNGGGIFNLYPVNIINDKFIWNGKEYK